jgi:hypothetical protein
VLQLPIGGHPAAAVLTSGDLFICAEDLLVESIRGVGATTHKMTSNCSLAASLLLD